MAKIEQRLREFADAVTNQDSFGQLHQQFCTTFKALGMAIIDAHGRLEDEMIDEGENEVARLEAEAKANGKPFDRTAAINLAENDSWRAVYTPEHTVKTVSVETVERLISEGRIPANLRTELIKTEQRQPSVRVLPQRVR